MPHKIMYLIFVKLWLSGKSAETNQIKSISVTYQSLVIKIFHIIVTYEIPQIVSATGKAGVLN